MPNKLVLPLLMFAVAVVGHSLAWYWFGWRLVVVLLVIAYANNLEQAVKRRRSPMDKLKGDYCPEKEICW